MNFFTRFKTKKSLHGENLIFDIGMHVGQDTEFYLKKGFRVVAAEANPRLAADASNRFKRYIDEGMLTIVNKGVSSSSHSSLTFYINKTDSAWSSFVESIGTRGGVFETINVDVIPFAEMITRFSCPYYLKIDIEGLDYQVISSLREVSARPTYVSAENGQEQMLLELSSLGYKSFKFINQAPIGGRRCVFPSKEGRSIDHTFPHGSSGEFGEDTPGEWLSLEKVIKLSNEYWSNPLRDANVHGWYDVHARIF